MTALRWCRRTGRGRIGGGEHLGLFIVWLRHAGPAVSGAEVEPGGGEVLSGPSVDPVRHERRINAVLIERVLPQLASLSEGGSTTLGLDRVRCAAQQIRLVKFLRSEVVECL